MTSPWNRRRRTVVVDLSRRKIRLAAAEFAGEAVRFHGMSAIEMDANESTRALDGRHSAERLRELVERRRWTGLPASCLLARSATSTQTFLFPEMSDSELRQAIELRLLETLHFDVEDACFDFRRVRSVAEDGRRQVLVLVSAARKESVRRALSLLKQAGLRPVAVGAAAESLANLAYHARICTEDQSTIHVDIGGDSTILNLFQGRLLRFSREIDTAGESFTQALMRPIITSAGPVQLTHDQAEEVKLVSGYPREDDYQALPHGVGSNEIAPLLEPVAQRLCNEIQRSVDYLRGLIGGDPVDRIVLSGTASRMRHLDAMLEENLGIPVTLMDPVKRATAHWHLSIRDSGNTNPTGFSALLGYSLGVQQPINLVSREHRLEFMADRISRVRRTATPFALAGAVCLCLAAIPVQRTYKAARTSIEQTVAQLQGRIEAELAFQRRYSEMLSSADRVALARGRLPSWTGLMQELSAILPEPVQINSFTTDRGQADARRLPSVELSAVIHDNVVPFEMVVTELTVALRHSPFFQDVHVVEASSERGGSSGRIELRMKITCAMHRPWESDS